ncbi:histone-lysine N-methyltransferase SETMAR [Trichonephila clavipes]|nr:histone-lysine N-methyltransferase SETMAR [Trichonephila clavipes]
MTHRRGLSPDEIANSFRELSENESDGVRPCAAMSLCVTDQHPLRTHMRHFQLCESCVFKMFKVIESPAKCEIRSFTRFLTARNMSAADIHRKITVVYGTEAMSDRKNGPEEGDDTLSQIVTRDEPWVSHITSKSKQQFLEWQHTSSPVQVKAKQMLSTRKIMATVFWDGHGVSLEEVMPQETTINSGVYCTTLRNIRRVLKNQRRGMLSKGEVVTSPERTGNGSPGSSLLTKSECPPGTGNKAEP